MSKRKTLTDVVVEPSVRFAGDYEITDIIKAAPGSAHLILEWEIMASLNFLQ